MTIPLTPEILASAYEYMRTTPPFRSWKLPHQSAIAWQVCNSPTHCGWYVPPQGNGLHRIAVSGTVTGHTKSLMRVMAHEMVHLHQCMRKTTTPKTQHNADFARLSAIVCRYHGFDPKMFV